MATEGQRAAFRRVARDLAQNAGILEDLDTELDEAEGQLNLSPLDASQHDRAVALQAACNIRNSLPQQADVAGLVVSEETSDGQKVRRRSYKSPELPAGYRPDWYRNSSGHQLIGLYASSSAALPVAV